MAIYSIQAYRAAEDRGWGGGQGKGKGGRGRTSGTGVGSKLQLSIYYLSQQVIKIVICTSFFVAYNKFYKMSLLQRFLCPDAPYK
jgi:hypothetical protein